LASAAAFALVVAGGVAYATIPDSNGVIHACYNKTTGALRVIDPSASQTCVSGEAPLSWNQGGIKWRGAWNPAVTYSVDDAVSLNGQSYVARVKNTNTSPPGVDWGLLARKGANGAPGTPGPAGISSGVSTTSGTQVPMNQAQVLTPVMTTPAVATGGQYYVSASMMLVVGSGDTVACLTAVNGTAGGPFATVGPVPNQTYETLPLAVSVAVPAGGTISIQCTGYTASPQSSFYDGAVTATLIDSDNPSAAATHTAAAPPKLPRAVGAAAPH
jgi:hypothetical protein